MNYLETYLAWKSTYRKETTSKNYSIWVKKFLKITPIENAKLEHIFEYSAFLKSQQYKDSTVSYGMAVVRDFVKFYEKKLNLSIDHRDIKPPKPRIRPHDFISPEEYVTILTWVKANTLNGLRDNCLIRLLYDSGARISEIVNIGSQGFDTENRTAQIWNAKRDNLGHIFWGSDTNKFLRQYITEKVDPLFPSVRQCQRIVQHYASLAGINKHIVCHSFRHGRAHLILDSGGTLKDVQDILRHSNPLSSFRYLNWSFEEKHKRANIFLKGGQNQ